jgi:beta-glucanase (GH16 family)
MPIAQRVFWVAAVGFLLPLLWFADSRAFSDDTFPNASGPFRYDSDGEPAGGTSIHRDWKLLWEDDFSRDSGIDPAKWNIDIDGKGGGNNELEYYTDSPKNAHIENGELVITAINDDGGHAFTSARMNTSRKFACRYGRIEAMIKVPRAQQGNWPAFWMMPQDAVYGDWPRSGEIDIMEVVDRSDELYGTCHYFGQRGHVHSGVRAIYPGHDFSEDYHLYAVEWDPREIRWYVDNHFYGCINTWYTASAAFPAPFNQKFFIILNFAVGGAWPKNPDATSRFPQSMHVKYVRVYQGENALPAPIAASVPAAVEGTPRVASGHPRTLWDDQDVAAYKASLTANSALKAAFDELRAWGDKRVAQPLNLPAFRLEQDGSWTFPDFKRGFKDASGNWNWEWNFNTALQKGAEDVSKLGMLFALTGDGKYGDFARQILLGLADDYGHGKGSTITDPNGYDHFGAYGFDGGDAGMFLARACNGYDLIFNLPSLSAEDRAHIEGDLIRPMAEHLEKVDFMYTSHGRWGMVCLYGVFIAGATLDDQPMLDLALYGRRGTKEKVTGGFIDCFQSDCLHDGVVWGQDTKIEEQMASVCVLTTVAEVMWHRGVDLYGYRDEAMRKSFDAALEWAGSGDISRLLGLPGIDAYAYAFRRYRDPRYLSVVSALKPDFTLAISERLPAPVGSK